MFIKVSENLFVILETPRLCLVGFVVGNVLSYVLGYILG